ncbi:MAG: iron-sulfur cluster assembly accessory protein [Tistrella sp.]|uniref:Fe-S cluster assembly scaffold SufA n=1 Tax=Tistrella mobilis TaxID=171437 RepID=A0A162KBP8_9PROT|nr:MULTISPECIES: iron-sulfur cluster assembly accessory protein [Tistrella]KYO50879.1 Fe-S cluster assembly scaffold SufA [Tistrella mobilis]MAD36168.1 iron-sulfur cluster assembly accessory protein [Tistrella sp.]MBA75288.1 iron-sulfur cluster assembly accessory protein [Tistrella sp.]HAE48842.1 iron-sulfur cluster assembly accessory protein [Tistrella mobilis]|tara:strand:+ start:184 stop:516 length:333 start_codon:yes stop_codon:yes gene_type:complete
MPMPALRITDAAADRLRGLMADKDGVVGIRVGVKTAGCSGLAYTMEMADDVAKHDEVIEEKGVRILIDPKAILFLIGTEMDWEEDKLQAGFVFRNPNEKGRCGCGESFHV